MGSNEYPAEKKNSNSMAISDLSSGDTPVDKPIVYKSS